MGLSTRLMVVLAGVDGSEERKKDGRNVMPKGADESYIF